MCGRAAFFVLSLGIVLSGLCLMYIYYHIISNMSIIFCENTTQSSFVIFVNYVAFKLVSNKKVVDIV